MPPKSIETLDQLQHRIITEYPDLSNRLKQIAKFVVDHPSEVALESIATIATRAGVQPSAIVRFAKFFGYNGFSAMQRVYKSQITDVSLSYGERIRHLLRNEKSTSGTVTPETILLELCQSNRMVLDALGGEVLPEHLTRAARILSDAKYIHLCAHRRSFPVVTYMMYALSQVHAKALLIDGVGGMRQQQMDRMSRDDALLAVSYHPYAEETVNTVREMSVRGIQTVVLTDGPLSPLVNYATVYLDVRDAEVYGFRSLAASMCVAQALTVVVGLNLESSHADAIGPHDK